MTDEKRHLLALKSDEKRHLLALKLTVKNLKKRLNTNPSVIGYENLVRLQDEISELKKAQG